MLLEDADNILRGLEAEMASLEVHETAELIERKLREALALGPLHEGKPQATKQHKATQSTTQSTTQHNTTQLLHFTSL